MSESDEKPRLGVLLQFASAYVIAVAAVSQYAYWSNFDVNILQYTTLPDLVKLAMWPLIGFMTAFLVGALLGQTRLLGGPPRPDISGLSRREKFRVFLRHDLHWGIFFLALVIMTAVGFYKQVPTRWISLGTIAGLTMATVLLREDFLSTVFPDAGFRARAIFVLTLLPWVAWGSAKTRAEEIQQGVQYQLATTTAEFRKTANIAPSDGLRHLGNTGSYTIFLIDGGPRVLVVRNEELGPMALAPAKK